MSRSAPGRGVTLAVGVVTLVAITVLLVATVGAGAIALVSDAPTPARPTALSLTADASGRIAVTHEGGAALSVASLTVRVRVDGTPLSHQPLVPFFAARGFHGGPSRPFNTASDGTWTAGETAGLRVAEMNAPALAPGARLTVWMYREGRSLVRLSTSVQALTGSSASASVPPVASAAASVSFSGT